MRRPPPTETDRFVSHLATVWTLMAEAPLELAWVASSARLARDLVRQALADGHFPASFIDDATIVTSELVANAVVHGAPVAAGGIQLRLQPAPAALRVEVTDGSHTAPVPRPAGDGGRGLQIVDAIATRWGTTSTTTGKTVWVELELPT